MAGSDDIAPVPKGSQVKKWISRIITVLGCSTILFMWWFDDLLKSIRPVKPVGIYTFRLSEHGDYVYISRTDHLILSGAWVFFYLLLFVAFLVEAILSEEA